MTCQHSTMIEALHPKACCQTKSYPHLTTLAHCNPNPIPLLCKTNDTLCVPWQLCQHNLLHACTNCAPAWFLSRGLLSLQQPLH